MILVPEVERALLDAVARDHARRHHRLRRFFPAGVSLRMPAVVLLGLLASSTIALAATGVIAIGSNVPVRGQPMPDTLLGVPSPGGTELLSLRAADPAGGPPWGMRLVQTTRGYLCVEVGRIEESRFGELGIDGAFDDDGRFHELPEDALPEGRGIGLDVSCQSPGRVGFARTVVGLDSATAGPSGGGSESPADLRSISFGVLGPHAQTVTYLSEAGVAKTVEVLPGLGAYLIVQDAATGQRVGEADETPAATSEPVVGPSEALAAITYRFGTRSCTVTRGSSALAACGFSEEGPPPTPAPMPAATVHPHVQLVVNHDEVTAADLIFEAPYPVTSGAERYSVYSTGCSGDPVGEGTSEDIATGATVQINLAPVLADGCSGVKLYYTREIGGSATPTELATVPVRIPPGDRP